MKALAIDYGTKNIGIAISDDTCTFAFPLETVPASKAIERIVQIIEEKKITQLVLGLPANMNGTEGVKAREAREFGKHLERTTGLIPEYVDETLTTYDAEEQMKEKRVKRKKRKEIIDQLAAQKILQEFLDHKSKGP